jgi:hypothetical protein
MIKNELKIKDISTAIRGAIVNMMVDGYFTESETGEVEFAPYFRDDFTVLAFANFVLDGVEFDKEDDVIELITSDNELNDLYDSYTTSNTYYSILMDVSDMVEFKKKQILNSSNNVNRYVEELLKLQIDNQKSQNKVTKSIEKFMSQYSKDEIMQITQSAKLLTEKTNSPEFQKGLVEAIDKVKPISPTDHKKSQRVKK